MSQDTLEKIRDFARRELVDQQAYLDSFAEAPLPLYRRFHDAGLSNWWLSKENGGLGIGLEDSVDIVSELAYGDAGAAFTLFISMLGTIMVALYGSDELKKRYLVPMAVGGGFCATLSSEREAGSELARTATTATRQGDDLVLTGEKLFSTNSGFADFLVVIAKAADDPFEQLAVLVPRQTPGVQMVKRWEMVGLRSSATYLIKLNDCRVSLENALSGHGVRLLEIGLNASRIMISTTAVGIARRVRDLCMDYANSKTLRGAALANSPVFASQLGQMEMQIEVMRNQCLAAAREFDSVMRRADAASEFLRSGTMKSALTAKMFCGQAGWNIVSTGSEMFGGLGYTHEMIIGKLLRDMRYVSIVEAGDHVLRDLVYSRYVVPVSKRV